MENTIKINKYYNKIIKVIPLYIKMYINILKDVNQNIKIFNTDKLEPEIIEDIKKFLRESNQDQILTKINSIFIYS